VSLARVTRVPTWRVGLHRVGLLSTYRSDGLRTGSCNQLNNEKLTIRGSRYSYRWYFTMAFGDWSQSPGECEWVIIELRAAGGCVGPTRKVLIFFLNHFVLSGSILGAHPSSSI
jgi:hypothetical protein